MYFLGNNKLEHLIELIFIGAKLIEQNVKIVKKGVQIYEIQNKEMLFIFKPLKIAVKLTRLQTLSLDFRAIFTINAL